MTAVLEKTSLSKEARELAGAAAGAIRERGWGRVLMCQEGGELCLVGAIAGAAAGLDRPQDEIEDAGWGLVRAAEDDAESESEAASPGVEVMHEVMRRTGASAPSGVWVWNDEHSEPDEILALLDDIAGR